MLQNKMIGRFWRYQVVLVVLWATACSHPSPPTRAKFQPSPTLTRHVTFLQWTDPHVFDAGKGRHAEGVREEELDNWAAFHWAVLESNRMVLAEHRNIDFVVITGDFGLENVQLPPIDGTPPEARDCSNRKPGDEGPIDRVPLADAAVAVARELDALIVKRVYLVPGNNDLCNEDPRDLHRWAEFVFALQQRLASLAQARQKNIPPTSQGTADDIHDLDGVKVFDLADSLAQLYGNDPRVTALFPNGKGPQHVEPQVINGIHLLGLDTAFFKTHDDPALQTIADTAISKEIDLVAGNIQAGNAYLLFTHIPDLKDPFQQPDGSYKASWKLQDKTPQDKTSRDNAVREKWRKSILEPTGVLGVFAGHFHTANRDLYPHNFTYSKPDETAAAKVWLAPPLAEKYQWRLPPEKTARGMLLVSVNADGDSRVSGEDGERVQPSAIWFSTADQKAVTGDEKLTLARAAELDHQWEEAATKYGSLLADANVDARTRTTALSGYWRAHEMTNSWWWQSRVARWIYLDGLPVLYSAGVLLPLLLVCFAVGLLLYGIYVVFKWLIQSHKTTPAVFRLLVPFHGRAIISSTVQLTADAPDKEFAARLRAEGEEIKKLLLAEKESWAAGHVTLLTPAGSSFDQLVGSIPKVDSIALSDWFRFFVNVTQTFRWTVQTGIAVFPPDKTMAPPPAPGSDKLVPDSEVTAYAVLQWAWVTRNSWHRKFKVKNDRSALGDLARELAELILGEAFV